MKKLPFFTLLLLAALALWLVKRPANVAAEDGIPDNCEYTHGAFYQPNIFARYEPQNSRLVLVNWSTGEDVKIVAEGLADTRIRGWSVDCRYLAGAVGNPESMDTVVWDVTTSTLIGKVPDAHLKPHPITWGPDDYLMVETRDGAVLWNVPANAQIHLDTGFNTTSDRNFTRLRWDAAHHQVTANLAVGGRVVYDLTNGQIIRTAANVSMSLPEKAANTTSIVIGGKEYNCVNGYRYGYRYWFRVEGSSVPFVTPRFNSRDHQIEITLFDQQHPYETLAVLEDHVEISSFNFRGWSPDCHYVVASVGQPKSTTTDTVVWDVVTNKRVGAFTDAHIIEHPIHWSPDGKLLLVETRDGAYIWNMATNEHVLMNAHVETALAGDSGIRSFFQVGWDTEKGQLLGVAVDNPSVITAYDTNNGQVVGHYPLSLFDKVYQDTPTVSPPRPTPLPNVPVEGINGMTEWQYTIGVYRSNYFGGHRCGDNEAYYDISTRQLVIVDLTTHVVIHTLEGDSNPVYAIHWSKGCRYVYGAVSEMPETTVPYDAASVDDLTINYSSYNVTFWDAQTGQRLLAFPRPYRFESPAELRWSPAGDRVVVRTTKGSFLYDLSAGTSVLLIYPTGSGEIDGDLEVYWDYSRGQILVSGWRGVIAFDMRTGIGRYTFTVNPSSKYTYCDVWGCKFSVTADNRMLFITSLRGMAIWNLDTLQHNLLDLVIWESYIKRQGAFSPDGNTFITAYDKIRVWNLRNTSTEARATTAIYEGPNDYVVQVHFVDNTTIETTDANGKIQRWDILSGKIVG